MQNELGDLAHCDTENVAGCRSLVLVYDPGMSDRHSLPNSCLLRYDTIFKRRRQLRLFTICTQTISSMSYKISMFNPPFTSVNVPMTHDRLTVSMHGVQSERPGPGPERTCRP